MFALDLHLICPFLHKVLAHSPVAVSWVLVALSCSIYTGQPVDTLTISFWSR